MSGVTAALEGRDVVRREEDRLAHERLEGLAVRLVARERERADRAPVEAALERDASGSARASARRVNFTAASIASVPLLQKKTRGMPESCARRSARSPCAGW